jgi:aldehyde:ferredoxin oxidoreductase
MDIHGYGRILDVDLDSGKTTEKEVDAEFGRKYVGGRGFGHRILYDHVGPEVDSFSPDNIIVFANGPLTGTGAPCAGRTEVVTKHPLSGGIGTGNTGGIWGARLKHAGFDLIIVRGKSERPVFLWIDDGKVELRDAADIWGNDARVTTDLLQQQLPPRTAVMSIGQAGERLVRYALALNDYYHVAGRCGAGGVMGSKKLKAIAVRGTGVPRAAKPEEFRQTVKEARERVRAGDEASWKPGPTSMTLFMDRGSKPGLGRSEQLKYSIGKGAICYGCSMNCYNDMGMVKEGKYAGLKESNITRTMVIGNFSSLGIDNLPAIWKCKDASQRLGIDYASSTRVISFAMRLLEEGIITPRDNDGLELHRGDEEAVLEMLRKIAYREGFGDVKTVKGMEGGTGPMMNPLGGNWWFLGGFTNPRGDPTTSTHWSAAQYNPNWPVDRYDMPDDMKSKIYGVSPERVAYTWEGKSMMLKWFEDLHSVVAGLGVCFFPTHMRLAMGPEYLSRLFSAYTGMDVSPAELMESGDRLFNLFKAYAVRAGQTREDDFTPLSSGQGSDGAYNDRIAAWLDEYYDLRGWDKSVGVPTKAKLFELGLDDLAEDLVRRGKIQ